MSTNSLVDIYSLVFNPGLHIAEIARAMGANKYTFQAWIMGRRVMPPDKRRHLADILEKKRAPYHEILAPRLRVEADNMENGKPSGRNSNWLNPTLPPPHARGDKIKLAEY